MSPAGRQTLQVRRVAIDTYRENVAYLHRECPIYRTEGFQALAKVAVQQDGDAQRILAVLNVVDDASIVDTHEIGLSIGSADLLPEVKRSETLKYACLHLFCFLLGLGLLLALRLAFPE